MADYLSKRITTHSNGTYSVETFDAPVETPGGILLPPGATYRQVVHDQFSPDGKDRIGMPEVWPLYLSSYSVLTEPWQWFWFRGGLVYPYTGYETWDESRLTRNELELLKAEWRSLTHQAKAFTNNHGTDNGKDYISGENLNLDDAKQGDIITCGNPVRVIGGDTAKGTPIETLDGTYGPPPLEIVNGLTRPDLWFRTTNVAADKSRGAGKWRPVYFWRDGIRYERVDPFPNVNQVPGAKSIDTLAPLRTNGQKAARTFGKAAQYSRTYTLASGIRVVVHFALNYIDSHRLADIEGTYAPSPYVMP